jgi:2',3'-cyclic-nucleotide 2'-phosphodiesterase (5'-nucleotidase family)
MLMLMLAGCVPPNPSLPGAIQLPVSDGIPAELVVSGSLSERVRADGSDLILYYGSEERGSLEPCGCPTRPRGGLARQAAYIDASRAASPEAAHVIVNGGYWLEDAVGLDGQPRPDAAVMNRWMVTGVSALGVDALNVGYPDMAGLRSLEAVPPGLPIVSANIAGDGVVPYRVLVVDGLRIGLTGISTSGSLAVSTPGFEVSDPARSGRAVLKELRERTDVIVLMSYHASQDARRLAREGLVDVVIDTQQYRERYAPIRVGDAIWVRSHMQTMRLGELRLVIEDGRIAQAMDRKIDLDPEVPDQRSLQAVVRSARTALDVAQRALYGRRP